MNQITRVSMNVAKEKAKAQPAGEDYVYDFCCEGCGSMGKLYVPVERRRLECPAQCGAIYVQWHPPDKLAALMCVACPVFETKYLGN